MKINLRRTVLAMFAVAASLVLASCGDDKKEEEFVWSGKPEYAEAAKLTKGKLRVGIECAYAPFNWTQNTKEVLNHPELEAYPIYGQSQYTFGYDVMFCKLLAEEMGFDLEIHKNDWSSIFMGMKQSHDYDVIMSGIIWKQEREATLDFTSAYYNRHNVIVVKADSPLASATNIEDFAGVTATTQINTNWPTYISQIPDVIDRGTYSETCAEVIMQVAMGSVDIGVMDWPTAYSGCLANPAVTIVDFEKTGGNGFITPPDASEACSVALDDTIDTKGTPNVLRDAIQLAMEKIGWDDAAMEKYMMLAIETMPLSE